VLDRAASLNIHPHLTMLRYGKHHQVAGMGQVEAQPVVVIPQQVGLTVCIARQSYLPCRHPQIPTQNSPQEIATQDKAPAQVWKCQAPRARLFVRR
jgi:hypothetical protein